jgi:hypothetical protein
MIAIDDGYLVIGSADRIGRDKLIDSMQDNDSMQIMHKHALRI